MLLEVPPLTLAELESAERGETSATVAQRVSAARRFAGQRAADDPSRCSGSLEDQYRLGPEARGLVRQALARECLGGRGYARILRLSRTIADLDGVSAVETRHVAEALALRLDHRRLG
jgi:magnesium chelatase family protein